MTAQGPRGFVWDKGALTKLGTLGSGEGSMAVAVNDRGAVVGVSPTMGSATTGFPHAFLWEKGMLTDLGTLPNAVYSYSVAAGINSRGDIVGSSYTAHGDEHAVLWKNGVAIDLDPSTGYSSSASSINELGQVVGSIGPAPSAFLWQNSVITTLGVLPGAGYSNASEINNRGQVVGTSGGFHPDWGYWQHAVIWDRGVATDLGVLSADTLSGQPASMRRVTWLAGAIRQVPARRRTHFYGGVASPSISGSGRLGRSTTKVTSSARGLANRSCGRSNRSPGCHLGREK
jgi:probable extracellular repeat, HAF family